LWGKLSPIPLCPRVTIFSVVFLVRCCIVDDSLTQLLLAVFKNFNDYYILARFYTKIWVLVRHQVMSSPRGAIYHQCVIN
jgi:hypothetical protein